MHHQVVSPPGRRGMNPLVKMLNVPKEPTCGQLDGWLLHVFSEDHRLDDGMLEQRHEGIVCSLRWVKVS